MKVLAWILIVVIAAPLPQALTACDVVPVQAEEIVTANMNDAEGEHDCCEGDRSEPSDTEEACSGFAHCSACCVAVGALAAIPAQPVTLPVHAIFPQMDSQLAPSHYHPPYRPPIA